MDLHYANTTALVFFEIPLFLLGWFVRIAIRQRDLVSGLGIALSAASAFLGMFGAMNPNSCSQQWTGLTLVLLATGIAATGLRQAIWKRWMPFALDVYLCVAWVLLLTGCRQALGSR